MYLLATSLLGRPSGFVSVLREIHQAQISWPPDALCPPYVVATEIFTEEATDANQISVASSLWSEFQRRMLELIAYVSHYTDSRTFEFLKTDYSLYLQMYATLQK